jgi:hypothetical protein
MNTKSPTTPDAPARGRETAAEIVHNNIRNRDALIDAIDTALQAARAEGAAEATERAAKIVRDEWDKWCAGSFQQKILERL